MKAILGLVLGVLFSSNVYAQGMNNCDGVAVKAAVQLWTQNDQNYFGPRLAVMPEALVTKLKVISVRPVRDGKNTEYNITMSNFQTGGSYNVLVNSSRQGCFVSAIISNN